MARLPALALTIALACSPGCGARNFTVADREAIEAMLDAQQAAWNRADLDAFMAAYARMPTLTFASGGQVLHGWDATMLRYRRRYGGAGGSASEMGVLMFQIVEIRPLSADNALVIGEFTLTETPRAGRGLFTLLVQRRPEGWRIVHDHTSAPG
jgi:ketosteroid isomerase-like protein